MGQTATRHRHGRPRRGVTLIELSVAMAILAVLVGFVLQGVSLARRMAAREEVMVRLTMRAQEELAGLCGERWDALGAGSRRIQESEVRGVVEIRDVRGLELKEITVRLEQDTPMGPCSVELATWRGPGGAR